MNDKRFISIPSHAINQLGAVREVKVPNSKVKKNRVAEIGIIKGDFVPWWGLKPQALVCHLYIVEEGSLINRFTAYRLLSAILLSSLY